jgi:hypothetical protein
MGYSIIHVRGLEIEKATRKGTETVKGPTGASLPNIRGESPQAQYIPRSSLLVTYV